MARRPSTDAKKTVPAGAPVPETPKLAVSKPETFADRLIREAARNGASLNDIASALQTAGCGHPCTTTISRSAAYQEGRALNPKTTRPRPWSQQERETVREGARQGQTAAELRAVLIELGSDRSARTIAASNHFFAGRRQATEDAALAEAAAKAVQQAEEQSKPVTRPPQLVVRHSDFPGVSLPFVPIQKDWGEVIAR